MLNRARPSGSSCRFVKPALRLFPLHRSLPRRIFRPRTFSRRRSRQLPRVRYPLPCVLPPIPPPSGPKKETVRIPLTPDPLRSSQKKTQPLIAMPNVVPQNPPIAVAPVEKSSMLLYWLLLAMSALILIIQIWTYFS